MDGGLKRTFALGICKFCSGARSKIAREAGAGFTTTFDELIRPLWNSGQASTRMPNTRLNTKAETSCSCSVRSWLWRIRLSRQLGGKEEVDCPEAQVLHEPAEFSAQASNAEIAGEIPAESASFRPR